MNERPSVDHHTVATDDAGVRLDRWFRRHLPTVPHSLLERWLRSGQVRVDGRRAEAGQRLQAGQVVRVPPHAAFERHRRTAAASPPDPRAVQALRDAMLYRDDDVFIINKPSGLAVQGGTGTRHHVDGLLDGLRFGGERPRLVHRLDRDTSGVLVLARSARAAAELADAFRRREVAKLYWAVVVGGPRHDEGRIDLPLTKLPGPRGERMRVDAMVGDKAITDFRVLGRAGRRFTWLALSPLTGRTHQLRVHCADYGMPILGDGKYGIAVAASAELDLGRGLHLHARALALPRGGGEPLIVTAPPPPHMVASLRALGLGEDHLAAMDEWPGAATVDRRRARGLSRR